MIYFIGHGAGLLRNSTKTTDVIIKRSGIIGGFPLGSPAVLAVVDLLHASVVLVNFVSMLE